MWKKNNQWKRLKQWIRQERRVLITSSSVAGSIILLRFLGLLQPFELAALDQLVRSRPRESFDDRVVIVEINESDIKRAKKWPIPDAEMALLLQKINSFKPRAIGLDIYRDLPQEPGHEALVNVSQSIPNLIGIERFQFDTSLGVPPPPFLKREQIGFNNFVYDIDGKVRRSLLYRYVNGEAYESFALKMALTYLEKEGVNPEPSKINPDYLQLGRGVFKPFSSHDGAYVGADAGGYQILANFRSPDSFPTVSMSAVLDGQVAADLMRDRLVLIGLKTSSTGDVFYTPYSYGFLKSAKTFFGVELHANFISQILSSSLEGRPLINVWSEPVEAVWIFVWSWLGAAFCWQFRSPKKSALSIFLGCSGLIAGAYIVFLWGYWIPLVPPLLGMLGSSIVIISYLAHLEEELNRSKEFLQKVINTIADPVFVKDREHRWIILNQAYCNFIGYPLETLIQNSDYDFFPQHEADAFWKQDELVFTTAKELENEEDFTDIRGNTHLIATKRSLHKDAVGNLFLVGVIRDITERKRIEEELKQTAAELSRSNEELKLSGDQLRHLAYHDPLTGLPNRKQFYERLQECLDLARSNNRVLALLFLDLDGFKQVNDTLGHDQGDELLKIVSQRLTGCLRGSDTVSRLAGDEFTVILPAIPRVEDAARVAEKILGTLSQAFVLGEHTVFVTVSIGISLYPINGDAVDILIKNADTAMYRAKELGRNRYEFI